MHSQIMDKLVEEGKNPKVTRTVQKQRGQYVQNIPARACDNMDIEKGDELTIEIFDNGFIVYFDDEEAGDRVQ